jgi:UDP-N-acetylmuramoyl-tripeptide--D-alanyl-D-alanine ligase
MTADTNTWRISEVLEATGGRLVCGDDTTRFQAISTDSRTTQGGELFVAISGQTHDGHRFVRDAFDRGAVGVVVSEAHMASESPDFGKGQCWVAASDTLRALGDLAAFRRRQSKVSVVAITGTNGKTTTKEMTAAVLGQTFSVLKTDGNFNNLIGLPLTLFRLKEDHEWAVVELAMNHPGEIGRLAEICEPQVGVITNVEAGHLAGVKDVDGVMKAKGELLEALGEAGTAVLNIDD